MTKPFSAALAAGVALCACSAPATVALPQAVDACSRGARSVELQDSGSVVRVLGTRESRSGAHLGFVVRLHGVLVRVEDNVDITGPIPLRAGEPVVLQGQYECNDGVLHWTHRDPSGRHQAGFVQAGGTRYQ